MSQSDHLVQDATQGPDIRLLIVRLFLANLRGQVIWCSNSCLSAVIGMLENSCDTKVTDFDRAILVHENVLCFEISMKNFSVVNMLDGQGHLNEPVEDLVFTVAHFSYLFLVSNLGIQVSTIGIVHDDTKTPLVHK